MTERDAIQNFEETLASLPITDDARTEARLCAVQAVFQYRLLGVDEGIADQFVLGPVKSRKADKKLFLALFDWVKGDGARLEQVIGGCLQDDWGFERVSSIGQALLLVAAVELATFADTPTGVVVSEYLALARAFVEEGQVGFFHGVLDGVAQKVRV